MRFCLYPLAALLALAIAPRAHADIDLRVGAGAGCQHATIQAAINAANNANGITNIKIARNLVYNAQQLTIVSKNVRLIGGYADCNQLDPDATHTVLNGAGGSANTVVAVSGNTTVVAFYHLDIIGGDEVESSSGVGGGVSVTGGPHALVFFDDTTIRDNRAGVGGGVWVSNQFSSNADDVYLYFGDNVHIDSNYGAYGGGGVYCSNAKVIFVGNNSYIARNSTAGTVGTLNINGSGGGVRAVNCHLWLGATSALGTLSQNNAGGNGGGLSITGERSTAYLYTRRANRPPAILLNTAGGVGGGIEMGSSASVYGFDLVVASNTARVGGGGISVFDNDDLPSSQVVLRGTLQGAPSDPSSPAGVAVQCDPALRCNRISDNQAVDAGGNDVPAAALRLSSVKDFLGAGFAGAYAYLYGTELSGNQGDSLLRLYTSSGGQNNSYAELTGTLIVDNAVSGTLLHNPDVGLLRLLHVTVAGNAVGGAQVIRSGGGFLFYLRNSIVWQPGKQVFGLVDGSVGASFVDYLLASDLTNLPVSTHNQVADPRFANAAGADYRLRLDSPGLDYAPRIADSNGDDAVTADHLPRPVDIASVGNEFGSYDIGAFERQYSCAADTLFCSGFE